MDITRRYCDVKTYFDTVLNVDKSTYTSSNDEPTPIACVEEMLAKVPLELWSRKGVKILDPCCGNGNFHFVAYHKLVEAGHCHEAILGSGLHFNDVNQARLDNVRAIFGEQARLSKTDFLTFQDGPVYDMVVANPPYARLLPDGKRASKNHTMVRDFVEKSLRVLKPGGYLVFIVPDNWMSLADRNAICSKLTRLQFHWLNIHEAKRHFKKVGSSFTWFVVENVPSYKDMTVQGVFKKTHYCDTVPSAPREYIPLLYNSVVHSILSKTLDAGHPAFRVETSSDLHKCTKKEDLSAVQGGEFVHKVIHTPKQTVYARRPHKFQHGFKVFISLTDTYQVFVDHCGMTQSIAFIRCPDEARAQEIAKTLSHPLYRFLNNICRYGNFNNVRVLQKFPIPASGNPYTDFGISPREQSFLENYL